MDEGLYFPHQIELGVSLFDKQLIQSSEYMLDREGEGECL